MKTTHRTEGDPARAAYDRIYTGFNPAGFLGFKRGYDAAVEDGRAQNEALRGALKEITERTRMVMDQTNGHWDTSKPSHLRLIRVLEGNNFIANQLLTTPTTKA